LEAWARQLQGAPPLELPQSPLAPAPPPPPIPPTQRLDPNRTGVVLAGPWRGQPAHWASHLQSLIQLQRRTGWPVLADALSGLRGQPELETVAAYDLLLERPDPGLAPAQVLRLGTLPASRRLEDWLVALDARQVLVSEADPRPLDPLARVAGQSDAGLVGWLAASGLGSGVPPVAGEGPQAAAPAPASLALAASWSRRSCAFCWVSSPSCMKDASGCSRSVSSHSCIASCCSSHRSSSTCNWLRAVIMAPQLSKRALALSRSACQCSSWLVSTLRKSR